MYANHGVKKGWEDHGVKKGGANHGVRHDDIYITA